MFFLEFELETCLNNAESVLVEARVVALAGTYDMTAHTPDHILVDVVVHGKSPVAELATMETSLRIVHVGVVVSRNKLPRLRGRSGDAGIVLHILVLVVEKEAQVAVSTPCIVALGVALTVYVHEDVLTLNAYMTLGCHKFARELEVVLRIGNLRTDGVDACYAYRIRSLELHVRTVFGCKLIVQADAYVEEVALLDERMVDQTGEEARTLIARVVGLLLERLGVGIYRTRTHELVVAMLVHQTNKTTAHTERRVGLRLLHRDLEARRRSALVAELMNEVTATQEVLLVEVVLDEDILRRNRTAVLA